MNIGEYLGDTCVNNHSLQSTVSMDVVLWVKTSHLVSLVKSHCNVNQVLPNLTNNQCTFSLNNVLMLSRH